MSQESLYLQSYLRSVKQVLEPIETLVMYLNEVAKNDESEALDKFFDEYFSHRVPHVEDNGENDPPLTNMVCTSPYNIFSVAVRNNCLPLVKYLSCCISTKLLFCPLQNAVVRGDNEMVEYLLSIGGSCEALLAGGAAKNSLEIMERAISFGARNWNQAMMCAINGGGKESVLFLIKTADQKLDMKKHLNHAKTIAERTGHYEIVKVFEDLEKV